MSVHLWFLGKDFYGVGATAKEAKIEGVKNLQMTAAVMASLDMTFSTELVERNARAIEFAVTKSPGDQDYEAVLIALLRGQSRTSVEPISPIEATLRPLIFAPPGVSAVVVDGSSVAAGTTSGGANGQSGSVHIASSSNVPVTVVDTTAPTTSSTSVESMPIESGVQNNEPITGSAIGEARTS